MPLLSRSLLSLGLLLSAVTLLAALTSPVLPRLPAADEQFDPYLAGISSVDEIMLVLDTAYPTATPLEKLEATDAILRRRFIHGYSYFRMDHNWAAAILRPIWDDLASPVRADDILKYRRAACSQQAIVQLEIARRLGFERMVAGAPGHFMAGIKIDGRWWVFDSNREIAIPRYPLDWLLRGDDRLQSIYEPGVAAHLLEGARTGGNHVRALNRNPAPRATLLHAATELFSRYAGFALLILWGLLQLALRRTTPAATLDQESALNGDQPQTRVLAA